MTVALLAGFATLPATAEPLITIVDFGKAAYNDSASNEIVVTVTRVDQDPGRRTRNSRWIAYWPAVAADRHAVGVDPRHGAEFQGPKGFEALPRAPRSAAGR